MAVAGGLDNRKHSAELLRRVDLAARRRLDAADVDDFGALVDDLVDPLESRRRAERPTAVEEGIGRGVDDRHDGRSAGAKFRVPQRSGRSSSLAIVTNRMVGIPPTLTVVGVAVVASPTLRLTPAHDAGDISVMRNDPQTKSSPADLLGAVPLFRGCTKDELKSLDRATTRADYPAGQCCAGKAPSARELMILLDGQAVVERDSVQITVLGPGDFIGEMSLLDGGPRSATVTAISAVSTLILLPHEFWQVIDDVPPIAHKLLSTLATRLRAADDVAYNH